VKSVVRSQMRRVPAKLRRARQQAGLSVFDVARKTGRTATFVAQRESARSYENRDLSECAKLPSLVYLFELAHALETTVDRLLL
jgi:transcriptional regulator with XRE-family HTH domain